jgi:hypothetical protein
VAPSRGSETPHLLLCGPKPLLQPQHLPRRMKGINGSCSY